MKYEKDMEETDGKGHHSWAHNERLQPLVTAEVHILTIHNTLLNKQQMSSADFII